MILALVAPSVLAAPSFLAVARVTKRRPFAPLVRGSLERTCVLAAAGIAAVSVLAQVVLVAGLSPIDQLDSSAIRLFFLAVPPVIGLAPWAAGELLTGASLRQEESFAASLCSAYLSSALFFGLAIPAGTAPALAASAAAATLFSTAAYLCTRGAAA